MNKQYNIVWNSARNMYVVASEFARGDSRIKSQVRAGGLVAALILASSAGYAEDREFEAPEGQKSTISGTYSNTTEKSQLPVISAGGKGTVVDDAGPVTVNFNTVDDAASAAIVVRNGAELILDDAGTTVNVNSTDNNSQVIAIDVLDAKATLDGGTYTTTGNNSTAIAVQTGSSTSASVDVRNAEISAGKYGIMVADDGAALTINNTQINAAGPFSAGIAAIGGKTAVNGSDVSITTKGDAAYGIYSASGGSMNLNNVTITTTGNGTYGIYNQEEMRVDNIDLSTSGEGSHGASTSYNAKSSLTLNGGTVHTSGENSYGLRAADQATLNATDLTVTSDKSYGVALENGGHATITNSKVEGADAGYYLVKGKKAYTNELTVDGGSITTSYADGSAFLVDSGAANITVKNFNTATPDNLLTVNTTTDAVTFNAENSTLTGVINANTDNVSMSLDNTSQWVLTGNSSVGNLTSSGRVTLGDANGNVGTLNVGNLTLNNDSVTDVWLSTASTAAPITAQQATLGGTLNITGFEGVEDLANQNAVTVVDAENAIAGDFSDITIAGMHSADFLALSGHVNAADNTLYDVSASLSWFAGEDNADAPAHGTFTIDDADDSFTIDTVLDDQPANAATGWDGESLVKEGEGTLILDADNTYSGDTHINDGTLWIGEDGAIGVDGSDQTIYVAEGATFGGDNGTANANVINDGTVKFDDTLTINGDMTNGGNIISGDITSDEKTTGNTLVINGDYISDNGAITINTKLGGDDSPTDLVKIAGDTSGDTTVYINNIGGEGALTENGIKVIDVGGESNGTFTQGNQVQVNAFEYRLYEDQGDWFLRSITSGGNNTPQYRADIGAYLGNQSMALSLQQQTLFDREGSQLRSDNGSLWARFKAGNNQSTAAGGNVDIDGNYSQLQLGSDLAAWSNGEQSLTVGVMGSYINSSTDSTGNEGADGSRLSASGDMDGYNVGVYATWFEDAQQHAGTYVDSWYQYGMYNNSVKNGDVGTTDYDSTAHAVSLEAGYRYDIALQNSTLSLTPQVQAIWQNYRADSVKDKSGTQIDGQNGDTLTTRMGLRVDSKLQKAPDAVIQPFAEVNWLHSSDEGAVTFGDIEVKQDLPSDRAELKVGIQANVNKQWSITAQAAGQKGSNDYSDLNGSLNVRYSW